MQGFRGRGWGYVGQLLKKLRHRMKIGEVLRMILEEEQLVSKLQKYHLPGVYQTGRIIGRKPDYYERGI